MYQSLANTASSAATVVPVTRAIRSTHLRPIFWYFGLPYDASTRFCEPQKAIWSSTTRILRWLRRSGRRHCPWSGRTGIIRYHSMPWLVQNSSIALWPGSFREPRWSKRNRTVTPRAEASAMAWKKSRVVSSRSEM